MQQGRDAQRRWLCFDVRYNVNECNYSSNSSSSVRMAMCLTIYTDTHIHPSKHTCPYVCIYGMMPTRVDQDEVQHCMAQLHTYIYLYFSHTCICEYLDCIYESCSILCTNVGILTMFIAIYSVCSMVVHSQQKVKDVNYGRRHMPPTLLPNLGLL